MNHIEFRHAGHLPRHPTFGEVLVLIDGTDLIDLVCRCENTSRVHVLDWGEMPHYAGLPPREVCLPSLHFVGDLEGAIYNDRCRSQVLECGCREPGCSPVDCRITASGETVVWDQFGWGDWDAEKPQARLGPFVFERSQLLEALEALGRAD